MRLPFESLIYQAPFAVLAFDRTSLKCIYRNQRARKLFGKNVIKLFGLFDKVPFHRLKHGTQLKDVRVRRSKRSTFLANVTFEMVRVQNKQVLVLTLQEVRVAYSDLIEQNRRLKELDLAKDRFVALTTHELRTPLSAMVSSADILRQQLYDTPEQLKEFVDIIYHQGIHLQELVDDILDFAKIRAGRMDFYIEHRDVGPLIQEIEESFKSFASSRNIQLQIEAPKVAKLCYFDEIRLRQVMANLVNNAIKYNHEGGRVRVWQETHPKWIRILIEDTGPGIPEKHFKTIFDEFETIGQVAKHHKGTGLGLPISQRLIEGMGGSIHLKSKVGRGSTFWIQIPKAQVLPKEVYRPRPDLSADLAAS